MLWLSETDVRAALSLPELIRAMGSALASFSAGKIVQPVRTALEIGNMAFFAVMPAFDGGRRVAGAKLVSVVAANTEKGLPTHQALIALFDGENGEPISVMDGRYITEVRTAAVSAVSVRCLARPDADVLAIIGSGVQARSHLEALSIVRQFGDIRAWSRNPEHLRRFATESEGRVRVAATAEEALRGAGVVVVATYATTPVIEARWVAPGAHVIAVGACRPNHRELDPELVARARLVVDSREAALREAGDVVQAIAEGRFGAEHLHAELGEILSGAKPGRSSREEITLFKSLGLAIEDVAAADLAYRAARKTGAGREI